MASFWDKVGGAAKWITDPKQLLTAAGFALGGPIGAGIGRAVGGVVPQSAGPVPWGALGANTDEFRKSTLSDGLQWEDVGQAGSDFLSGYSAGKVGQQIPGLRNLEGAFGAGAGGAGAFGAGGAGAGGAGAGGIQNLDKLAPGQIPGQATLSAGMTPGVPKAMEIGKYSTDAMGHGGGMTAPHSPFEIGQYDSAQARAPGVVPHNWRNVSHGMDADVNLGFESAVEHLNGGTAPSFQPPDLYSALQTPPPPLSPVQPNYGVTNLRAPTPQYASPPALNQATRAAEVMDLGSPTNYGTPEPLAAADDYLALPDPDYLATDYEHLAPGDGGNFLSGAWSKAGDVVDSARSNFEDLTLAEKMYLTSQGVGAVGDAFGGGPNIDKEGVAMLGEMGMFSPTQRRQPTNFDEWRSQRARR
jgi:hypothetical protein